MYLKVLDEQDRRGEGEGGGEYLRGSGKGEGEEYR